MELDFFFRDQILIFMKLIQEGESTNVGTSNMGYC
jgi:hypothetical protein